MVKLRKNMHVIVKEVLHGSTPPRYAKDPKFSVKLTKGMTGRVIGLETLVNVRLDKRPELKYFYLPKELAVQKKVKKTPVTIDRHGGDADDFMKKLILFTHNKGKAHEISDLAARFGVKLELPQGEIDKLEVQANSVTEVSKFSAIHAFQKLKKPLAVDDSGLFINALKGFPGVYSAHVENTIGNSGVLKLMTGVQDRRAYFECCATFCDESGARPFTARVDGEILHEAGGNNGFGFDPIFAPFGFGGKSFGEIERRIKNDVSHRGKAFTLLFEWFSKQP